MKVRKAIIPAAGLGTRFLPATKAQPKEMLPLVDKPTIQYIIEEAIESGIKDIIIVTGRSKRSIEDHFDRSYELESALLARNKYEQLEEINRISNLVDIHYIRQKEVNGLGHAIWCARKFIGEEPFAVLLGDDVVVSKTPCLQQLISLYDQHHTNIIGVQKVIEAEVVNYGIVELDQHLRDGCTIRNIIEKPSIEEAPSQLAVMGRYILQPEIFDILEHQKPGLGDEIQLTDALCSLLGKQSILAHTIEGKRYDVGTKKGFIEATLEIALNRRDLRNDVIHIIKRLVEQIDVDELGDRNWM
ncbi:UTP--glucose-1-phosphate uridylyltransferase GalU [Brevibacillus daliensis]|uniref:UTP--glucose-1-phosphate uridylyltransferase GalU n=1 Tax=Brevibacillus daliensis TaxID=2892995 RepID=UPI001E3895A2|nr:UTP--glucose-1-phosphate uridylyltransferase GalU [Brevibacillus daliensis]